MFDFFILHHLTIPKQLSSYFPALNYNTPRARRSGSSITVPVSESQFVEWVQGSGGVILVSPIWLQEVIFEFFHLKYNLAYC